jgi:hypothetical protein
MDLNIIANQVGITKESARKKLTAWVNMGILQEIMTEVFQFVKKDDRDSLLPKSDIAFMHRGVKTSIITIARKNNLGGFVKMISWQENSVMYVLLSLQIGHAYAE